MLDRSALPVIEAVYEPRGFRGPMGADDDVLERVAAESAGEDVGPEIANPLTSFLPADPCGL
jgi:hypothetical protein